MRHRKMARESKSLFRIFISAVLLTTTSAIAIPLFDSKESSQLTSKIGGIITQDTVRTLANNPYILTSDLNVNPGVNLTIEASIVAKPNRFVLASSIIALGEQLGLFNIFVQK